MSSRQERKRAEKRRNEIALDYRNRLGLIFENSITFENLPDELPKRYLTRVLREKGGIAYDKISGLYLPYVRMGIDVYGLPTGYTLVGYDGTVFTRRADEVIILRTNPHSVPIQQFLDIQIEKIVEFDISILQNLDAIKTMSVIDVPDIKMLNTLQNLDDSRRIGASVAFASSLATKSLNVFSTNAQFFIDKLNEARREIWNDTLAYLGISTANVDKRERVQSAEIVATEGYSYDCLNILIDTFNYDAEIGGLPIRVRANTIMYEQLENEINNAEENEND